MSSQHVCMELSEYPCHMIEFPTANCAHTIRTIYNLRSKLEEVLAIVKITKLTKPRIYTYYGINTQLVTNNYDVKKNFLFFVKISIIPQLSSAVTAMVNFMQLYSKIQRLLAEIVCFILKGKVFYGQEPPSGESTTTESGVNYQLLSVMH